MIQAAKIFLLLHLSSVLIGSAVAQRHVQEGRGGKPAVLVGFEPLTDVRDQARIDLDQQLIVNLLGEEDFDTAQLVYQEGSFSKSVSLLSVPDGLPVDLSQGATLTGSNADGGSVRVFAQGSNYTAGATELSVQYLDEGCYVGPNPDPITAGCLAASGTLAIDGTDTTFSYDYDPLTSSNVYNIQGFTSSGEYSFAEGEPLTVDFQKFVDFYGSESYADDIIMAALAGSATDFPTGKNLDMSAMGTAGRAEIAKKGTAYLAVWMYVIRELEHAIYLCETGDCAEESCLGKAAVHEVDEAVAFYAGSLEGPDGAGSGVLAYNLADSRAANFKTAGENGDSIEGTAKVNLDLLEAFNSASDHIVAAQCAEVRDDTTRIVQLMTIPLVQATLRYTFLTRPGGDEETDEAGNAERAIFAAAVLPFVAACNVDDADSIYENTKTGATNIDFAAVKSAFERNYECMGITAADIGGLWDATTGTYYEGFEAPESEDNNAPSSVGSNRLSLAVTSFVLAIYMTLAPQLLV